MFGSVTAAAPQTYTISYNANGGTGAPAAQTKTENVNLTLSSTKPTRTSTTSGAATITFDANGGSTPASTSLSKSDTTTYSFTNWNTVAGGTGSTYASGATYTANASATLYAQWSSSTTKGSIKTPVATTKTGVSTTSSITATFNAGEGSPTPSPIQGTITNTTPYTFNNWNTSSAGTGTAYAANTSYNTFTANTTLYATFTAGTMVTTYPTITLPAAPSKSGYIFSGWFTEEGSGTLVGQPGAQVQLTTNQTLYAHYSYDAPSIKYEFGTDSTPVDVAFKNANGKMIVQKIVLTGSTGTSLPSSGEEGQLFFLKE